MATPLSRADYKGRYNHPTTGKYKANNSQLITSAEHRDMIDQSDSFVNKVDDLSLVTSDTSGSTITLDFGSTALSYEKRFVGSASFATPKTIALANNTNAKHFTFLFEITSIAATLTFPSGFKSGDTRYNNPSALIFTSTEIGIFKVTGDYTGSSWILEFSVLPAV